MTRVLLRITGRVQGVGFRYSAWQQAMRLGLTGWVRNLPDSAVEAEVQGDPAAVEQFVAWARRGPGGAAVDDVETRPLPSEPAEQGFRISG